MYLTLLNLLCSSISLISGQITYPDMPWSRCGRITEVGLYLFIYLFICLVLALKFVCLHCRKKERKKERKKGKKSVFCLCIRYILNVIICSITFLVHLYLNSNVDPFPCAIPLMKITKQDSFFYYSIIVYCWLC